MDAATIDLFCPDCGSRTLQVMERERPIQETKVICPSCLQPSKIAQLKTVTGVSCQKHMRRRDPNSAVGKYPPHLR